MRNYDDIINLQRPISKHPKMSLYQRSAQFAPFAALTGYDGQVKETARLTFERKDSLEDYIKTGTIINAPVTKEIIQTIYKKFMKKVKKM